MLIRHAATDTGGRLCGSLDLPLSLDGRRQVQALIIRRAIRAAPDALFSSPLIRARGVAVVLAQRWLLELHMANWAREIHCGFLEGKPLARIRRECADVWHHIEAQNDDTFASAIGSTAIVTMSPIAI